jgi:signal transduction histidine kinase
VALGVQLALARRLAERDAPEMAETFERLQTQTTDALENLRDLARGIYPPLLADQGLVAALDAQAHKATIAVDVRSEGIGRYDQEIEAAIYFCVLEALQNVAKYANASGAHVRLTDADGRIGVRGHRRRRRVRPRPNGTRNGARNGASGMKDRLEALGGSLTVTSSVGAGSTVGRFDPCPAAGHPLTRPAAASVTIGRPHRQEQR